MTPQPPGPTTTRAGATATTRSGATAVGTRAGVGPSVGTSAPARPRQEWMDVVRGTAVLLIIGFHATALLDTYGGVDAPRWAEQVNTVLTPLRIPVLVLLSGMLLGASLRKGRGPYVAGKLRNVAWPYVVWALVWGALAWPVYSVVGFALGGSYLWFLLYLLTFYAAAWLVRAVPPEAVVVAGLVASGLAAGGPTDAERWPYLFAVFMLGHVVTVRPALRTWLFSSGWALVAAAVLLALHLALPLGYDYGLESGLFVLAGGIVLVRLARRFASARLLRPVRYVGRSSVVYYVAHYPVMAAVAMVAGSLGVGSVGGLMLVMVVASLLASTVLVRLRGRAPVAWLFTAPRLRPRVIRLP